MSEKTRKLCNLSILAAMAYIAVFLVRIPIVPGVEFLKFEPKDVIILIGGLIYGPVSAAMLSAVVSLIEMVTISTTGIIGAVMNILSSCSYACIASLIYSRNRTLKGAIIGLVSGGLVMTVIMLLWNYLITPLYMGYPREAVAAMLVPVFLPFNLIKAAINGSITMLIYKPLSHVLLKNTQHVSPPVEKRATLGVIIVSLAILATVTLIVLVMRGVI
ncbi:MAG: ECF transporter S component [Clostridia bacterium]|nr:ECF transporter S component [Clostridia bacterium]